MADRDHLVYMAKLAEQSERYEDMRDFMKQVAFMDVALDVDERNLLSVAYKNVAGARRASWRVISTIEQKEAADEIDWKKEEIQTQRVLIEKELVEVCKEILEVLNKVVAKDEEANVFYKKMAGDYHRYHAEFDSDESILQNAKQSYQDATEIAEASLLATNPIRLGLALNFSVFYYEILNEHQKACELAKSAFDDAVTGLDSLPEESYRDATLIMQLLRDNLTLWRSNDDE
eukprot:TRINITY_DN776059_c0_g1_i1.p1 TRINITY_DN776059_c0_g1~~TRINITY_DN776059_c0_g1_i1.p1  ORF type:complete len:232 (-),score=74.13 TRINITY_DN776059_c0_g1_i1:125-820(-)